MRKMKDSGVDWIGLIPQDWKIRRTKDIFIRVNEKAHEEKPVVLSLARSGVKIRDISTGEGQLAENYNNYNPVRINDLLLNPMDLYSGANCSVSKVEGVISPAYINLRIKENNNPTYYDYYFKTQYWSMALFAHGKGVSFDNRWTLGLETALNYFIPIPEVHEQNKIANFLDSKVGKINKVIEKTKETIEEYRKYKLSIITQAVTKGINPNAKMKKSGINWIGDIPYNWKVEKIKNNVYLKTGRTPTTEIEEYFNGEIDWYTPGDFKDDYILKKSERTLSQKAKVDNQAIIIPANTTMIIGIGGTAGKIGFTIKECSCNQQITALIGKNIDNEYLMFWLIANTKYLKETALYTTLPILNNQTIGEYFIVKPDSISEQKKIVTYLKNKCQQIDLIIKQENKLIKQLENYKKSLIYEYVTGKKEVKETSIADETKLEGKKVNCIDNIFAQAILLCKIIEKLNKYNLGRVKAEKTLYLIEKELGFDFSNNYVREKAGPLAQPIYKCETIISKRNKWVKVKKVKQHIEYEILSDFNKYKKYYNNYYSGYDDKIEKVIDIIKDCSKDKAEMIATLYASWNDFIIKGENVSDIKIVKDVRENWNDSKKRFNEETWLNALNEMKKIGLVPKGHGNLTVIKEQ